MLKRSNPSASSTRIAASTIASRVSGSRRRGGGRDGTRSHGGGGIAGPSSVPIWNSVLAANGLRESASVGRTLFDKDERSSSSRCSRGVIDEFRGSDTGAGGRGVPAPLARGRRDDRGGD